MQESKLIAVIKTFSAKEFKLFGDFLNSPIHNTHANTIALYDALKNYYPHFKSDKLSKQDIFKYVFPKCKKYNDQVLRDVMSYLYKQSEDFLIYLNNYENDLNSHRILIDELQKRGLFHLLNSELNAFEKKIHNYKYKNEDYYWYKYWLQTKQIEVYKVKYEGQWHKYKETDLFRNVLLPLHQYYMSKLMEHYIVGVNISLESDYEFDREFPEKVIELLRKFVPVDELPVKILTELTYLTEHEDDKRYATLKHILFKNEKQLEYGFINVCISYMQNYCVWQKRKGKKEFNKELYELYEYRYTKGILVENGFIHNVRYVNYVSILIQEKQYDQAAQFIETYKIYLKEDVSESTYSYCKAIYFFHTGKFEEALKYLQKVKKDRTYIPVIIKSMYLSIYYELNEIRPFYAMVENYKHYLHTQKIMQPDKTEQFYIFIDAVCFLMQQKEKPNHKALIAFKKQIVSQGAFVSKGWVLEKIQRLMQH